MNKYLAIASMWVAVGICSINAPQAAIVIAFVAMVATMIVAVA
jgi:hypothetical protein